MSIAFGSFSGTEYKKTALNNNTVFASYFTRYSMAARNMFQWENLPSTVVEKFIEDSLFYKGQCIFVDHPIYSYLALNATVIKKDFNNRPIEFQAYGSNGSIELKTNLTNSVLVSNNTDRIATAFYVDDYCERLWRIQSTIDINMNAQKTPILILCANEKDKKTLQAIYKNFNDFSPVIFGDKNRGIENAVAVLKTDAPYLIDKLYTYKQQVEHELQTILGIENTDIVDKKERLNVDEVNMNSENTTISGNNFLTMRQEAAKLANELFGWNCSVKYRPLETKEKTNDNYNEEGEDDEV